MFKTLVVCCVLAVAMSAPAPAPQEIPQVPGLEAYLEALRIHAEQERVVNAAAALFPPNTGSVVGPTGNIGPSGIVGSSGNIGPSGLCGPSGCVAFGR